MIKWLILRGVLKKILHTANEALEKASQWSVLVLGRAGAPVRRQAISLAWPHTPSRLPDAQASQRSFEGKADASKWRIVRWQGVCKWVTIRRETSIVGVH